MLIPDGANILQKSFHTLRYSLSTCGRVTHRHHLLDYFAKRSRRLGNVFFLLKRKLVPIPQLSESKTEQESPPAWTQEAYRQRRIKYSICYLRWGTPPGQVWWEGGGGNPRWGIPGQVQQRWVYLRWGTPNWTWLGYPPPPNRCGQTENITFPHPSHAVGNNLALLLNILILTNYLGNSGQIRHHKVKTVTSFAYHPQVLLSKVSSKLIRAWPTFSRLCVNCNKETPLSPHI